MRATAVLLLLVAASALSSKKATSSSQRPSGLYYESGERAQTVLARGLSAKERRHLQQEMLHLLGLSRQPRLRRKPIRTASAPSFLLHVYRAMHWPSHQEDMDLQWDGGPDTPAPPNATSLDDSDLIMSFPNHGHGPWWSGARPLRHEGERRLWFDVSQIPDDEDILQAEVRIYKEARHAPQTDSTDTEEGKSDEPELEVRLHQLVAGNLPQELKTKLVATTNASWELDSWLLLDVTSAVREWVAFPFSNQGLLVELILRDGDGEITPTAGGLVGLQGPEPRKPFMVAYFRNRNYQELVSSDLENSHENLLQSSERDEINLQHSPPLIRGTRSVKRRHDVSYPESIQDAYSEFSNERKRLCQRKTLYINFKQLRWEEWIIAPDGYKADYCEGVCSFPLHAHLNATNHAIVQTLVHLMQPSKVPKPCCAPTNLSPISVLYFDDNSNVILRKYPNMVVRSCGCH